MKTLKQCILQKFQLGKYVCFCIQLSSGKVEIFLEQREVAFLSPDKICENFDFSTKIQIFAKFLG